MINVGKNVSKQVSELKADIAHNVVRVWDYAIGDDVADDTSGIQAALDYAYDNGKSKVLFGSATYRITSGLILPPDVEIDFETCTIHAVFDTGNILTTKHDPTGKPVFKVKGNRAEIVGASSTTDNPNLNGLWIDTCNFSRFEGLVFQSLRGYAIVLGATGARDIINITIEDIETNTGKCLKIMAGVVDGVDYQEVTDGRIKDCFWSCSTYEGTKALEVITNNHVDGTGSSVFGITFERCSFNPTHPNGATMIDMRASGISTIYAMQFQNCEGELRYTGSTPTYPLIYLSGITDSVFDVKGYFHQSNGVQLVGSSNNVFNNLFDGNTNTANTGRFINIDSSSHGNIFNNVCFQFFKQMSTELGVTNAPLSSYFFTQRIVDNGRMNRFNGQITSQPQRIFKTDYLRFISATGSDQLHPLLIGNESTLAWVANADGTYTVTMTNETGFKFRVPTDVAIGTKIVIRVKYKFNSATPSGWIIKASSDGSGRTVNMSMSSSYIDQMFETNVSGRENVIMSTVAQSNVVLQIAKLEMFVGGFPYPFNYAPSDIIFDSFSQNPYFTTAGRPTNIAKGFSGYDTTLDKLISWNGTVWKDATGATV